MQIDSWLKDFENHWKKGKAGKVLTLFTENVDYYETPSTKLDNEEIRKEWTGIKHQENIELQLELFSSTGQKHTVKWSLSYQKNGGKN